METLCIVILHAYVPHNPPNVTLEVVSVKCPISINNKATIYWQDGPYILYDEQINDTMEALHKVQQVKLITVFNLLSISYSRI